MRNRGPFDTFIYNVGSKPRSFLKQFLPGFPRLGNFFFPLSAGLRFPEGEEVAEVGLFPVRDVLTLGFAALIVGMGVVKGTVEAGMEVGAAVRACSGSRNPIGNIELLSTPVAYFHGSPPEWSVLNSYS